MPSPIRSWRPARGRFRRIRRGLSWHRAQQCPPSFLFDPSSYAIGRDRCRLRSPAPSPLIITSNRKFGRAPHCAPRGRRSFVGTSRRSTKSSFASCFFRIRTSPGSRRPFAAPTAGARAQECASTHARMCTHTNTLSHTHTHTRARARAREAGMRFRTSGRSTGRGSTASGSRQSAISPSGAHSRAGAP